MWPKIVTKIKAREFRFSLSRFAQVTLVISFVLFFLYPFLSWLGLDVFAGKLAVYGYFLCVLTVVLQIADFKRASLKKSDFKFVWLGELRFFLAFGFRLTARRLRKLFI